MDRTPSPDPQDCKRKAPEEKHRRKKSKLSVAESSASKRKAAEGSEGSEGSEKYKREKTEHSIKKSEEFKREDIIWSRFHANIKEIRTIIDQNPLAVPESDVKECYDLIVSFNNLLPRSEANVDQLVEYVRQSEQWRYEFREKYSVLGSQLKGERILARLKQVNEETLPRIRERLANLERQGLPPATEVNLQHQKVMRELVPHADVSNALKPYRDMPDEDLALKRYNAERRRAQLTREGRNLSLKEEQTNDDKERLDTIEEEKDNIANNIADLGVEKTIRNAIQDPQARKDARALRDQRLAVIEEIKQIRHVIRWIIEELGDNVIDSTVKEQLNHTCAAAKELLTIANELMPKPLERPLKQGIKPEVFEIARQNFLDQISVDSLGQPTKLERSAARDSFAQMAGSDGGLVFDVDETLIDRSGGREAAMTMPKDFIESAERLVNGGIPVAIITARTIESVIEALENGGAKRGLIDNFEIYGEYGITHKSPDTDGKIIISDKKAEKYIYLAKEVLYAIWERINGDPELKEIPHIGWHHTKFGATVYRSTYVRHYLKEKAKNEKIADRDIEEKLNSIENRISNAISDVLEKKYEYRAFCKVHTSPLSFEVKPKEAQKLLPGQTTSDATILQPNSPGRIESQIDIRLNKDTTGIEFSKGTAVASLVKRLRLRSVVAFGDDLPDLDMNKALLQFIATNQHVDGYISDKENRLKLLKKLISGLTATEDQIQTRIQLNEELLSLHRSTLESQAFVGVKHPKGLLPTEDAIIKASTFMLEKPHDTVDFIREMTNKFTSEFEMSHSINEELRNPTIHNDASAERFLNTIATDFVKNMHTFHFKSIPAFTNGFPYLFQKLQAHMEKRNVSIPMIERFERLLSEGIDNISLQPPGLSLANDESQFHKMMDPWLLATIPIRDNAMEVKKITELKDAFDCYRDLDEMKKSLSEEKVRSFVDSLDKIRQGIRDRALLGESADLRDFDTDREQRAMIVEQFKQHTIKRALEISGTTMEDAKACRINYEYEVNRIKKYFNTCEDNLQDCISEIKKCSSEGSSYDVFLQKLKNLMDIKKETRKAIYIIKFRKEYPTIDDIIQEHDRNIPVNLKEMHKDLSGRYWRWVARKSAESKGKQLTDEEFETYYQNFCREVDQKIQNLSEKAEVWMRREPEALIKTLEWRCGRFTTSINSALEEGEAEPMLENRNKSEKAIHGYLEDTPMERRILYAYPTEDPNGQCDFPAMKSNRFGSVAIHFKSEVKLRSTKLLGDPWLVTDGLSYLDGRPVPYNAANRDCFPISWENMEEDDPHMLNTDFKRRIDPDDFRGGWRACQMRYDDPRDLNSIDEVRPWAEVQVHGGLTIDDVEEVVFPEAIPQDTKETLTNLLDKYNIKWRSYP